MRITPGVRFVLEAHKNYSEPQLAAVSEMCTEGVCCGFVFFFSSHPKVGVQQKVLRIF